MNAKNSRKRFWIVILVVLFGLTMTENVWAKSSGKGALPRASAKGAKAGSASRVKPQTPKPQPPAKAVPAPTVKPEKPAPAVTPTPPTPTPDLGKTPPPANVPSAVQAEVYAASEEKDKDNPANALAELDSLVVSSNRAFRGGDLGPCFTGSAKAIELGEKLLGSTAAPFSAPGQTKKIKGLLSKAYMIRGTSAVAYNESPDSLADLKKAVEYDPNNADAWACMGSYYIMIPADYNAANDALSRALAIDPNNSYAFTFKGVLAKRQFDNNGCLQYGIKAVQADPGNAWAYIVRGMGYLFKNDEENARLCLADCNQAIALNPNIAEAYFNRHFARAILNGRKPPDMEDMNKALAMKPSLYKFLRIYGYVK